ncbi:MAG TPA: septal ring lytic transglycosylase RlpA family protein [Stenotrophomonas sp.]|jgi:rare lipoprotein A|uniref:Endolytic peptidoglycan transglycosylase RlpA n=1 Tax=Stenotrophomonas maltophilia TaxID=40324 RepID=A0A4S2CZ17_STEMA|nr:MULTISPECIES: septal ring lytic transglycosylase RlpA family protein [Stenotrophomonas]TGY33852.1 septal ring lytic transglycosylase RlpA family protein [Stenotrophomonas maltophilia]HBS61728.1 septal ring lytic transglycosylase RlpA family protein [Stenotrophomonas sp.]
MNATARFRWLIPGMLILALAACSSAPKKPAAGIGGSKPAGTVVQGKGKGGRPAHCPDGSPYAAAAEDPSTRGDYRAGGLYKPGVNDSTPTYIPNVACIPEPEVVDLPRSPVGNKSPYVVLGKQYEVMDRTAGYAEKGTASYYGAKFHGRLTSNREVYDMYAFTAAHKTLPLPSFARVTNLDNGESVIVRVNDRGPFHDGRVIDLSYAAAVRLGITQRGTGNVEVRALSPGQDNLLASADKPSRRERREAATAARASEMDALVGKLPAAAAATARTPPKAGAEAYRYRVADSAKPGNADNFDAWMRDNGVRVATGKPAATQAAPTDSAPVSVAALPAAAPRAPMPVAAAPARPAAGASLPQQVLGSVLLQVASFASRDNATRALGQLSSAGIAGASLSDIVSGGRTLWRLRVPAPDHASASELAGRIAGLGFGAPQIVKD